MKNIEKNSLGYKIRYARDYARLTQAELAGRMGVSKRTVIKWEQNETTPKPPMVKEIAGITQTSSDWLLTASDAIESTFIDGGILDPSGKKRGLFVDQSEYQNKVIDRAESHTYNPAKHDSPSIHTAEVESMKDKIIALQSKVIELQEEIIQLKDEIKSAKIQGKLKERISG